MLSSRARGYAPIRHIVVVAALAAAFPAGLIPAPTAQVAVESGLTGVVRVVARPSRRLASAGAYPGRAVAVSVDHDASELANVIVFVDAPPSPSAPSRRAIRQVDEQFLPRLIAITTGSTVDFPNDDLLFHNVFSLSRAALFDLGRYPRGQSRHRRFERAGLVKVYCHLHSHMSALVRVFDHPFFAIPDADGRFFIPGLAPGPHRVVAWHERVGEVSTSVVIDESRATHVAFSLPLTDGPE